MNQRRLKKIRCLLMDVDGVLTDGKLHFTSDGEEFKTFDVQDGHGIAMAQRAGLAIGFVSGRPSRATAKRARDLKVKILMQGAVNKMKMVEKIKRKHGLSDEQIAFIGDELVDLPVLRHAGFAVAVPNAVREVKAAAHYVTRRAGGDGAVREVIEVILKAQGSWRRVIAKYLAAVALVCVAGSTALAADGGTSDAAPVVATGFIEKFEVPERDENGNLRWKLSGEKAQIDETGVMNVINARAEFYGSNTVEMVFSAPTCVLDRINRRATTDADVRIERPGMIVTGTGADWNDDTKLFTVRSNVTVEVQNAGPVLALPGTTK
jgi:3-deoxy-D-manno-octulosonate 8-phosphate phosphatase (KDO 8-P phosphatase)